MFNATAPKGYESLYFDRDERRLSGGVRKYIGRRTPDKVPSSYMDELDYQEPLHFEFLIYVATETVWRADLNRFRDKFRAAAPDRDFFAFLKATDGLLHKGGPARLNVALESLDKLLREVQVACGSETEIVLFSDHGMNLEENRRVHLQTHLRAQGYDVVGRMNRKRAGMNSSRRRVVAPGFGLCGYAAIYCAEETDEHELAEALCDLEGVDFSVHRDEDSVVVCGPRGRARIRRRERAGGEIAYSYQRLSGDPLRLNAIGGSLESQGLIDAEGFAPESVWLSRTAQHEYPDALANLHGSLHSERVRHPADVLVSLRDGYYYGASAFSHMIRLMATHGNAMLPSTTAFLMSTHQKFPEYVRATEARPYLR
jgi:hypothetical protein